MLISPSLTGSDGDFHLPVTSLPAHDYTNPNSVPDSTDQVVQEVKDELARLMGEKKSNTPMWSRNENGW